MDAVQKIRGHAKGLEAFGVKHLWVFGSTACGDRGARDVDVLVEFTRPPGLLDYMGLKFNPSVRDHRRGGQAAAREHDGDRTNGSVACDRWVSSCAGACLWQTSYDPFCHGLYGGSAARSAVKSQAMTPSALPNAKAETSCGLLANLA